MCKVVKQYFPQSYKLDFNISAHVYVPTCLISFFSELNSVKQRLIICILTKKHWHLLLFITNYSELSTAHLSDTFTCSMPCRCMTKCFSSRGKTLWWRHCISRCEHFGHPPHHHTGGQGAAALSYLQWAAPSQHHQPENRLSAGYTSIFTTQEVNIF